MSTGSELYLKTLPKNWALGLTLKDIITLTFEAAECYYAQQIELGFKGGR